MPPFSSFVSPIHSVEDPTRLISVFKPLGLGVMTVTDQTKFLEVFSRGLRLLSEHEPDAAKWSTAIAQIAKTELDQKAIQLDASAAELSLLTKTILDQPASFISPRQQDACLAYASKVALSICLKLTHTNPKQTCHGIKQLFKSSAADWAKVRGPQLHDDRDTPIDKDGLKQIVQNFIVSTDRFKAVSIPPISSFLANTSVPDVGIGQVAVPAVKQPTEETQAKPIKRQKPPDDLAPDRNLFEAQILRSIHPDLADGHRLPNNWNRLSTAELNPTVQKLRSQLLQLGDEHRAGRVHAAARFISLFSGLSLKTCFTMPIAGRGTNRCKGTMHLDLNHGLLRRDTLCVVDRKTRLQKLRLRGRWWRLHIPPQILTILVEAVGFAPEAQTLGELVHSVGLDHESCQHLLNDGFPTSHQPEDTRLANSFRTCLLDLDVHPALIARVTGDISTTPLADHFYLSFSEHQVHEVIAKFCNWAGLQTPPKPGKDRLIGSPKSLSLKEFQEITSHLNHAVLSAKNMVTARSNIKVVIDFHNLLIRPK